MLLSRLPRARPEMLVSSFEEIGEVLRPPTNGRLDLVTANLDCATTLRLTRETPAPVSIAKTNGPAPLIHPVANKPRSRSSRRRIGAIVVEMTRDVSVR
jgi:hypothetical protein